MNLGCEYWNVYSVCGRVPYLGAVERQARRVNQSHVGREIERARIVLRVHSHAQRREVHARGGRHQLDIGRVQADVHGRLEPAAVVLVERGQRLADADQRALQLDAAVAARATEGAARAANVEVAREQLRPGGR